MDIKGEAGMLQVGFELPSYATISRCSMADK